MGETSAMQAPNPKGVLASVALTKLKWARPKSADNKGNRVRLWRLSLGCYQMSHPSSWLFSEASFSNLLDLAGC